MRSSIKSNRSGVLYKKKTLNTETYAQRESHVKMKGEIKVIHLQANECQRLTVNHRTPVGRHGTHSPSQLSEETNPTDTLISDFQPPEL